MYFLRSLIVYFVKCNLRLVQLDAFMTALQLSVAM